jgi:hypothetical protein
MAGPGVPAVRVSVGRDRPPVGTRCPELKRRRDHGSWYFAVQVTEPNGRRNRVRRGGFHSRAMAERQLAAALEQPEQLAVRQVWTMRRWLEYWLSVIEQRMRPSATRAYRSVIRHHLIPLLGSLRLDEVDVRNRNLTGSLFRKRRHGEAVELRCADLDAAGGYLHVREQVVLGRRRLPRQPTEIDGRRAVARARRGRQRPPESHPAQPRPLQLRHHRRHLLDGHTRTRPRRHRRHRTTAALPRQVPHAT